MRRAQPRARQGGKAGSRSRAGGLTRCCLQARGWRWRPASSTASPKAAGLGSPCHPAGERPSWPNSPGARARDVPLPGATGRSSAQKSLGLSRGLSDGRGWGSTLPCPAGPSARACCPCRRAGPWGSGVDACGHLGPRSSWRAEPGPGSPAEQSHARSSVPRVDKCGTLFCEGGQKTPEHGYCTLTISSGVCQAVVQDGSTAYEPVPKGTKCGEEQVGRTRVPVRLLGSGRACRAQSRASAL